MTKDEADYQLGQIYARMKIRELREQQANQLLTGKKKQQRRLKRVLLHFEKKRSCVAGTPAQ